MNLLKKMPTLFLILCAIVLTSGTAWAELTRMTADAQSGVVMGVDSQNPLFGWEFDVPGAYSVLQTSYQIQVASTRQALAEARPDCWDSGQVQSDSSFGIRYEGAALQSSRRYFWRAIVSWKGENAEGSETSGTFSRDAEFVTGVIDPEEWQAEWITAERVDADPMPLFYREFKLDQPKGEIADAFLHVCGLGQQIVSVNALRVGERTSIDPGWTNYRKTCLYTTFDVRKELVESTSELDPEACSVSVLLGNGMYNVPGGRYVKFTGTFGLPKMIARLVVRYKDGSVQTVVSDGSWLALPSPVVFSCVYGGDDVDLSRGVVSKERIATLGRPAPVVLTTSPGGTLRAQNNPPVVVIERVDPVGIRTLPDGRVEADFGFNFAGSPTFRCVPPAQGAVRVSLAEMPEQPWNGHYDEYKFGAPSAPAEGEISFETALTGEASLAPSETFSPVSSKDELSPVFGYWGFQYAYFEGADYRPNVGEVESAQDRALITEIKADRIGANLDRVGYFESDGASLNEIDQMIDRSVRSNIVSLMTDCPHREKLGWLEETHLMGPSILYRYDLQTLYRKICRDISEAQLDDGMVPDIAPEYTRFVHGFFWSAEWSAATVQLPWLLWKWYGDCDIIARQYETMDRYVRYTASIRNEQGLVKAGLGDWFDWSPEKCHAGYSQHTPGELTATAFLCENARIMAIFADMLGKSEDVEYYNRLRKEGIAAFRAAYFNPETNVVATGSQASYAFALYFDLIPEEARAGAFQNLLDDIEKWQYRMSCGEVAWTFLIKTLADFGRNDVLWKMIQREDAPGYVHMLHHWKMKTLSETWDGPGSSMNHFMFGAIQEWFSSDLAGIRQTKDSVAFKKLLLRPSPMPGKISNARGGYRSPFGAVSSEWNLDSETGTFTWNVAIPAGSEARLEIPVGGPETRVLIERIDVEKSNGAKELKGEYVRSAGDNPDRLCADTGSGVYRITSNLSR